MVRTDPGHDLGVKIDFPFQGEGLEEVLHQGARQRLNHSVVQCGFDDGVTSAAAVQCHHGQGFVKGDDCVSHTPDPSCFTQSLIESPPERNGDVFYQVVPANVKITFCF